MADEPRRSVRATKGQHTKSLDILDQPAEPPKKRAAKKASAKKAASQDTEEEEEIIRCICGVTEQDDESDEDWIACESCSAWQHNVCMGVTTDMAELEKMKYFCEQCRPEDHRDLLDAIARGEKPWEERRRAHEQAELEAQKAKKGKKGKKRTSDPKSEAEQNGKVKSPDTATEIKKEKKETVGRAGSTKRKAQEETQEESAKAKIRKVSAATESSPPHEPAPSDIPASITDLDKARQGAAKLIHKNLHFAMKNAQKHGNFKGSDADLDQKATRLALEIERATHDTHANQTVYAAQARKVAANLKSNQELCDRLLARKLTPRILATMTDDEMASKELQRQTAEMKARADKQSIMVTEEGPRIRRTHKGDEMVEQDTIVPASEELPSGGRRRMLDPNDEMGQRSREGSHGDGAELPMDIDEYRSRDDIRGNAAPSEPLTIQTGPPPPAARKNSTQVGNFDINNVFSKVQSPTTTSGQHPRKPSIQAPPKNGPGVDPDIDRLLEDGNESPPYSPTEFEADPSIVWRGSLLMNSVADFPAVARHVAGADLSKLGDDRVPWSDLIPERLTVAGRIDPEKATTYLCSLRYSSPTDLVVVSLSPAGEAAAEQFRLLYEYFHSKNRYGVVGNKGIANVRDTYLVPVPAGSESPPEFLLNLDNSKLPENRPEPLILVTIVVRNDIPHHSDAVRSFDGNGSPSAIQNHPQRQMSLSGPPGPAVSPLASQGSFNSPATPQTQPPPINPSNPQEIQRQQRLEAQRRGEELAASILGPLISAPTVSFLMPQAWQMQPTEWNIIKEIFTQHQRSQEDLTFLSQLLEQRNPPNANPNTNSNPDPNQNPNPGQAFNPADHRAT